jgi:hypothetical protein
LAEVVEVVVVGADVEVVTPPPVVAVAPEAGGFTEN